MCRGGGLIHHGWGHPVPGKHPSCNCATVWESLVKLLKQKSAPLHVGVRAHRTRSWNPPPHPPSTLDVRATGDVPTTMVHTHTEMFLPWMCTNPPLETVGFCCANVCTCDCARSKCVRDSCVLCHLRRNAEEIRINSVSARKNRRLKSRTLGGLLSHHVCMGGGSGHERGGGTEVVFTLVTALAF